MNILDRWNLEYKALLEGQSIAGGFALGGALVLCLLFVIFRRRRAHKNERNKKTWSTLLLNVLTSLGKICLFLGIFWLFIISVNGTSEMDFKEEFLAKHADEIFKNKTEEVPLTNLELYTGGSQQLYINRNKNKEDQVTVRYMVEDEDGYKFEEITENETIKIRYKLTNKAPTLSITTKRFANNQLAKKFNEETYVYGILRTYRKSAYSFLDESGTYVFNIPEGSIKEEYDLKIKNKNKDKDGYRLFIGKSAE